MVHDTDKAHLKTFLQPAVTAAMIMSGCGQGHELAKHIASFHG